MTKPLTATSFQCHRKHYRQGLPKGEHDKAIHDYTNAIKTDPSYANAYNNRGLAWRNKGENDKADADFKEAKRLESLGD